MSYYTNHASEYIESTIHQEMEHEYALFECHLKKHASILDVGFGSGRDSLYFKDRGYEVEGIDPEKPFVDHALSLGLNVRQCGVLELDTKKKYDGIWCCASLLHLKREDMLKALEKLQDMLTDDGVLYVSLKYREDIREGTDDMGRFFTYINQEDIDALPYPKLSVTFRKEPIRPVTWASLVLTKRKK